MTDKCSCLKKLFFYLGAIYKWRHPKEGCNKNSDLGDFQGITGVTRGGKLVLNVVKVVVNTNKLLSYL